MVTITFETPITFAREGGRSPVTLISANRSWEHDPWWFRDEDRNTWYRRESWDNGDGLMAFCIPDSSRGAAIYMSPETFSRLTNA